MIKPTRLRSAWASTQSNQSLRYALNGWLRTQGFFMRTAKTDQTGGCPSWSEYLLGAHSFCWFCHEVAHMCNTVLLHWNSQMMINNGPCCSSIKLFSNVLRFFKNQATNSLKRTLIIYGIYNYMWAKIITVFVFSICWNLIIYIIRGLSPKFVDKACKIVIRQNKMMCVCWLTIQR